MSIQMLTHNAGVTRSSHVYPAIRTLAWPKC